MTFKEHTYDRKRKLKEIDDDCEIQILHCSYPKPQKRAQQNLSLEQSASNMKERTKIDTAWILGGVDCFNNNDSPPKKTPGTWSAFNSLTHRKNET